MKRTGLLSLFFALHMILSLIACTGSLPETEAPTKEEETPALQESQTAAETEPPVNLYAGLGEADFNGYEFRLMYQNEEEAHFSLMEDYMGEPVDDAIFEANAKVMDLAKINLMPVYNESPMSALRAANKSGDLFFDVASDRDGSTAPAVLEGTALNLYKLPNINWEGDWWPQFTLDALTLRGTMLMYSNYASYRSCYSTFAILANMDMIDQYGLEHPHDLVRENRWTLDKLIAMTKDTRDDINGDGLMDYENDVWGFAHTSYYYNHFPAWNIEIYDKTEDGQDLYLHVGEDVANLMEKLYYWYCESPGVFNAPTLLDVNPGDIFLNKHTVFVYRGITWVENLMGTNINYAILPMPKLDETVPEYYSGCHDRPHCVPKIYSTDAYDMLGYVLEAMAISGYEKIYPAYVETALKYRYSPSEDDSEMVDMIFKNRILSFSWLYSNELFPRMMDHLFTKDSFTYSSYIAAGRKKNEAWIQRLQDKMLDLGDNG